MEISPRLAELLGIFAADGSMQENYLCMWGNISEDKAYYDNVVCPLFSEIFNKKIVAHDKRSNSVYGFYLCGKKAVDFLKYFGFCKRKTYVVEIPKDVIESSDPQVLASFVRGFSDCDGGISFMKRKGSYNEFKTKFHTYPRVHVVSVSEKIIRQLSDILKKLGVKHTILMERRNFPEKDNYKICVRGPERVKDWMDKIGFNNPAQISRYLVWKKLGFCPAKSNIEQRQLILANKLDPYSFYAPDRI